MSERFALRSCRGSRLGWWFLLMSAVMTGSGCAAVQGVRDYVAYNDTVNDFVIGYRNDAWARNAWHTRKAQFAGEPHRQAFGAGFRDGYVSVASGGCDCPPPLPPRRYWTWKYQSPEGQAQVAAWFAGFPHGAKAAQEDGAGLFQEIQVSHLIERQYSPEFFHGHLMPAEPNPNHALPGGSHELIPPPGQEPRPFGPAMNELGPPRAPAGPMRLDEPAGGLPVEPAGEGPSAPAPTPPMNGAATGAPFGVQPVSYQTAGDVPRNLRIPDFVPIRVPPVRSSPTVPYEGR